MESILRGKIYQLQKELALYLRQASDEKKSEGLSNAFQIILKFDSLASYLYEARANLPPSHPLVRQTEDIVATLSQDFVLLQQNRSGKEGYYGGFIRRYRILWRKNFALFLFTVLVFIGSCLLGYELTTQTPEFASVVLSQGTIEDILQKKEWFKGLEKSPLLDGIGIAMNNIGVATKCFLGGALLGIGGAFLLIFNGVMFGAVLGFCANHGFQDALTHFVIGHGPLELSIIVAAAFSGFIFGAAFYKRPVSLFKYRMAKTATESGILLLGILPWLVLAASIEAFVSPWDFIPIEVKMISGVACALLFWTWTFGPISTRERNTLKNDITFQ